MSRFAVYTSILAAAGLLLTWHAIRETPDAARRLSRKHSEIENLRRLQGRADQVADAMEFLERAGPARPLTEILANRPAEVRPRKDIPLLQGWILKSVDVVFNDVAFADAAAFMLTAENAMPPWRIARCTLDAGHEPGRGRVALVMETAGRSAP